MKRNSSKLKILNFTLLFLVFNFTLYVPAAVAAGVARLEFVTPAPTVAPGAISDIITVQTQDAAGAEAKMEETGDLTFVSSAATGEFLNASGEPVSIVMNRNSANRNFYYRDSVIGTPTLTVTVTGRASGAAWSASQTITVGSTAPPDNNDDNGTTTPSTAITTTGDGAPSAHSSQTPLSQVSLSEPFKIGAGRARLGSVHSPIAFSIETSGSPPGGINYQWSFGDGGAASGERVTHRYQFPGDYVVMINAIGVDGQSAAVGRTTVSVIAPALAFGRLAVDGFEFINHSAKEINLGGWRLKQGSSGFIFPTDTILPANRNLVIPSANLGFALAVGRPLTLAFPDGTVALETASWTPGFHWTPGVQDSISARLPELVESLRHLSAQLTAFKVARQAATVARPVSIPTPISPAPQLAAVGASPSTELTTVITVPKPPGFFARIKQWFSQ